MIFEYNEQINKYLSEKGKIVLNACPGSGKTTAIAKKIIDLEDECQLIYGNYFGIACLSFTNTAKDEINEKYYELSCRSIKYPHIVSTIDSFINQYITLPFYYLLNRESKRPKILEDNSFLDDIWLDKYRYKGVDDKLICFHYPPSSIQFEKDGSYSSNGAKPDKAKVNEQIFSQYCKALKRWQVNKGLISTGDSAYLALHLLSTFPSIGEWLSTRFPHVIIDEAQDNSDIQHAIFDKLIAGGLRNIELIGDPYQSLYEWRDAKPDLFLKKYKDTANWKGLDFTNNRRSHQKIIDCFSILRKKDDPEIQSISNNSHEIPIIIYKYNANNAPDIIKHYDNLCKTLNFRKNHIVVRGNSLKNKMLGKDGDLEPWKNNISYKILLAHTQFQGNEIKEAVNTMRGIYVNLKYSDIDYQTQKEIEQGIKYNHEYNSLFMNTLHNLPSFSLSIMDWTVQTEKFLQEYFEIEKVDFEIKRHSSKFKKETRSDSMIKHFKKSFTESNNIPITTIHHIKGKTLDSILIFFNDSKHKENITFDDINSDNKDTFPSEKQRLIYVAMSRPKHMLAMAFPEKIDNQDIYQKFGIDVKIVTRFDEV